MTRLAARHGHPAWWAFVVHRVSGLALAVFLPVHFYVLALAVETARFDAFARWTDAPLVKLAETALVAALAAHLAGGVRLLLVELGPMGNRHKDGIAAGFGLAVLAGLLFLFAAW